MSNNIPEYSELSAIKDTGLTEVDKLMHAPLGIPETVYSLDITKKSINELYQIAYRYCVKYNTLIKSIEEN